METLISEIKGSIQPRLITATPAPSSPVLSPVTRQVPDESFPFQHGVTSLNPEQVTALLQTCRERQNEQDLAHDTEDLRQVMRSALQAGSDAEIIDVLQVSRHEMPEAMKTLQRALEVEVEKDRDVEQSMIEDVDVFSEEAEPLEGLSSSQSSSSSRSKLRTDSTASARARSSKDTLDREFLESGIEALRRMSEGVKLTLPSWTITKWEVDREEKIGVGFFSDVYKGTWREMAVAIKVLAPTTPQALFVHEIEIWKSLSHPNVLTLFGASSTTAEPPWFFVSPYMKHGSLVRYLKNLDSHSPTNPLKMIYEVAMGMAYLHGAEVLHGDLKVSWCSSVLVGLSNLTRPTGCQCSRGRRSSLCHLRLRSKRNEVRGLARQRKVPSSWVFNRRIARNCVPHYPPTDGTLRWQAPELMTGDNNKFVASMDIYAFAMCCVEILNKGNLPWPLLDDDLVRRIVLSAFTLISP